MNVSVVRRELLAVVLSLLALFLVAALIAGWDARAGLEGCGSARGLTGPVGACLRGALVALVGVPAAILIPVALVVHALRLFGRTPVTPGREWMPFLAGLIALLPIVVALAIGAGRDAVAHSATGLWGSFVAYHLRGLLGPVGAWIALLLAFSALTVTTLAWNPIRVLIGTASAARSTEKSESSGRRRDGRGNDGTSPGSADTVEAPSRGIPAVSSGLVEVAATASGASRWDDRESTHGGRSRRGAAATELTRAIAVEVETSGKLNPYTEELPPLDLLTPPDGRNVEQDRRQLDDLAAELIETLRTFGVDAEIVGRTTGPVVTQFEVKPARGVKVRQIATLANDLALAMRAESIRIVAPIPGRGAVGVEVPNPTPEVVGLRELIESSAFQRARGLPIALGKDLEGKPVIADLAKMPHLLVAGATGSGKSVCINTLITSLIYSHTRHTLRFLMIDPKMVELSAYNALPHLRHDVITDNQDAADVLGWAVLEMQRRYELLAANGCRNMEEFNRRHQAGSRLVQPRTPYLPVEGEPYTGGPLPYIVVVIDELADLIMTVQGQVERPLAMLAQKARAIGIHLILATQRPSVNVITGLIKANFPSRIAFRVASQVDSRTIIDGVGAEALLGNGDMLFIPPGKSEPARLQGAFIPTEDTERLMRWYEEQKENRRRAAEARGLLPEEPRHRESDVLQEIREHEREEASIQAESAEPGERDKLFREAAEIVIQHQQGSTSLLQRRLKIGYGRAARVIDQLYDAGVLGPPDGSRPRDVLIGLEDLDRVCGRRD